MTYEIKPYEAEDGWRWRMVAGNNRIVADSAEAYADPRNVDRAIAKLKASLGLGLVDRDQFIIIRKRHWEKATEQLRNHFYHFGLTAWRKVESWVKLVEDAAV